MAPDKIKALARARARIAALERSIATELNRELARLPARFGFSDTASFIAAVKGAAGRGSGRRRSLILAGANGGKRRTRARINDDIRTQVRERVEAGETGRNIAQQLRISLPSVQNIKKALGLVKARKQAAHTN
jgi:hypothetical protein